MLATSISRCFRWSSWISDLWVKLEIGYVFFEICELLAFWLSYHIISNSRKVGYLRFFFKWLPRPHLFTFNIIRQQHICSLLVFCFNWMEYTTMPCICFTVIHLFSMDTAKALFIWFGARFQQRVGFLCGPAVIIVKF